MKESTDERGLEIPEHGLGQAFREAMAGAGEQVRAGHGGLNQRHLENIRTFCRHRVKTTWPRGRTARSWPANGKPGYRNRDHFKTAIYFFCGGLDLNPVSS